MRSPLKVTGVVVLTMVLTWLGLAAGHGSGHVPAVWWTNAALVSFLLRDRYRFPAPAVQPALIRARSPVRPVLLAAAYAGISIARLAFGDPPAHALTLSACDAGEAAIAAYLLMRVCPRGIDLTRQSHLLRLALCAVVAAPLVAAIAAGFLLHIATRSSFAVAVPWFASRALGMAIILPSSLGLARRHLRLLRRPARLIRILPCLLAIAVLTAAALAGSDGSWLFLVIPLLLLLASQLQLSGGALGCLVVAGVVTAFTSRRAANVAGFSSEHRILFLQLFLAAAVLSVGTLAVVLGEQKRIAREVRQSELRYLSLTASMEMLARIDPVTLLANRRRFDETLQHEWQRALRNKVPLSLVLFETDFFPDYDEQYGHAAADACLRRIAEKLRARARRPADLAARFGSEEFALVLPETAAEGALVWADRLRQEIEALGCVSLASPSGLVTVSGGCATMIPAPCMTALDLLQAADAALYEARRKGRNRVEAVHEGQTVARAN